MKTSKSKTTQTVIALLIMFVAGYFIPTWGPVTRMGVQYLCIMIGWIYMSIVTGGLLLSSVVALTARLLHGIIHRGHHAGQQHHPADDLHLHHGVHLPEDPDR